MHFSCVTLDHPKRLTISKLKNNVSLFGFQKKVSFWVLTKCIFINSVNNWTFNNFTDLFTERHVSVLFGSEWCNFVVGFIVVNLSVMSTEAQLFHSSRAVAEGRGG